jgi:hypothetical protein
VSPDLQPLIIGMLEGIAIAVVFLLALFIGFCVILNIPKLRPTSRKSMVIKSLEERVGEPIRYLPPSTPRGPIDQLGAGTRQAAAS